MSDVGKWIVNYDNGLKFGVIDLRCPYCDGCVVCPKVDIPNFCGKCGAFMKEMSEAPTIEERPHGEWIPCSERLPEIRFDLNSRTSDTVFVCLENRTMHMAFYCDDDVWRFCESGEAKEPMWNKVIAWMPLPERYGEEASE